MTDPVVDILVEDLKSTESFRPFIYDDSTWPSRQVFRDECYRSGSQYKVSRTTGTATIGYGETNAEVIDQWWDRDDYPETEAARQLAEISFRNYLLPALKHLKNADQLNPNQKAAIGSFAYNIGVGGWANSSLRREIEIDPFNYDAISAAFHRWDNPDGVLRSRRQAEINRYFSPWQEEEDEAELVIVIAD